MDRVGDQGDAPRQQAERQLDSEETGVHQDADPPLQDPVPGSFLFVGCGLATALGQPDEGSSHRSHG